MTTPALKTRFVIEDCVAAKGWKLLAWMVSNRSGEIICLCHTAGRHPFVTYKFNAEDGGFYHGNYFATEMEGRHDFFKRAEFAY